MATVKLSDGMSFRVLNGFVDKGWVVQPFIGEDHVEIEIITTEEYLKLQADGKIHRDDRAA